MAVTRRGKNRPPLFQGIGVALVTLFDEAGRLLASDTAQLARRLVDRGVRAVLLAGTTGESWALDGEERCALVKATKAVVPSHIPVIVGTGAGTTAASCAMTAAVHAVGADAALVAAAAGSSPVDFFTQVAQAAPGMPLLAYHLPLLSPLDFPVSRLGELPIIGIKDSSDDMARITEEVERFAGDVYVGSSNMLTFAHSIGADGALLALANIAPEDCAAAFAGDLAAQQRLVALHERSLADFPGGLKRMVAEATGFSASVRVAPR
jgi:4-hydroxy-tetrahydrodipicolinate synthase